MSQQQQEVDWKKIVDATPYPIEAFAFVRDGLDFTVRHVHEDPKSLSNDDRHISGQQLCLGLRESAIEKYGLLAPIVLEQWNIGRTSDFGRIVFAMIEAGQMSRTSSDTLEDFQAVYDFKEAFSRPALVDRIGMRK